MNIITLRTRGLPLTREPNSTDEHGNSVFRLNGDKLDPFDVCEQCRRRVFPDAKLGFDLKFEQIRQQRRQQRETNNW